MPRGQIQLLSPSHSNPTAIYSSKQLSAAKHTSTSGGNLTPICLSRIDRDEHSSNHEDHWQLHWMDSIAYLLCTSAGKKQKMLAAAYPLRLFFSGIFNNHKVHNRWTVLKQHPRQHQFYLQYMYRKSFHQERANTAKVKVMALHRKRLAFSQHLPASEANIQVIINLYAQCQWPCISHHCAHRPALLSCIKSI